MKTLAEYLAVFFGTGVGCWLGVVAVVTLSIYAFGPTGGSHTCGLWTIGPMFFGAIGGGPVGMILGYKLACAPFDRRSAKSGLDDPMRIEHFDRRDPK